MTWASTVREAAVGLTWDDVCADPSLRDLPYKIETNEWGQVVMSPTRLKHGAFQVAIARLLDRLVGGGKVVSECAVRTSKGTKVADVGWFSTELWERVKDESDSPVAPEICVEILSPSNSPGEIEMKKQLYFAAGAREVWICDANGKLSLHGPDGRLQASALASAVPAQIEP